VPPPCHPCCHCLIYTLQLFLCCGLCWLCRCGCYDDGGDWEDPDGGHPEVIVVDATEDENAQLSQPLIVKDAVDAQPAPDEGGGGGVAAADGNAAAVTNQ